MLITSPRPPAQFKTCLNRQRPKRRHRRSIESMAKKRVVPHSEAKQILRRAGYPPELIDKIMRDLPDPIDTERDAEAFTKWGISNEALVDRMGASP